jgi:hypothetical protein
MAVNRRASCMAMRLFACLLVAAATPVAAQDRPGDELFRTLQAHDREFFDRGFNQCDLEYLQRAVHPGLRFYHDQGGFQDYAAFMENTRRYICASGDGKPVRELDPGSLEVFPLFADGALYAAIQTGTHRFYLRKAGAPDRLTSSARFTHVYVLEGGRWLLKDVLSYDHRAVGD